MDQDMLLLRQIITTALLAVVGLALGSFYALVAFRMPRHLPLHAPPSLCPHCGNRIFWRDNIPVFGWLLRRGKCRFCEERISLRYPVIEAATGFAFATVGWRVSGYGWDQHATAACIGMDLVLLSALIVAGAIDSEEGIIPDFFSILGLVCVFLAALLLEIRPSGQPTTVFQAITGLLAGLAVAFAIRMGGNMFLRRRVAVERSADATIDACFGYGDCKLLAICGGYLGWRGLFPLLLVASVVAAIVGICRKKRCPDGSSIIPFGPFIALGTWAAMVFDWSWLGW